ncbi:hypothetical protein DCAR_0103894 [Daucus carota subsp. sativus]|uniref:Uncharacterized protein n=1 Tax=Daucus carota subsp. sativus TaxID=79200 RepID=A0AAF0W7I8_DAUCS|nr:hypothetical protein DCAR_0103894 [Daucus carota subsp. sativus]
MAAAAYRCGGSRLLSSSKRLFISKTLTPKSFPTPSASTSFTPLRYFYSSYVLYSTLLFASVLASVESLMPLHSAIASARLTSKIALHSSCWSCLSQGFATPL